jgi:hypothetical protein
VAAANEAKQLPTAALDRWNISSVRSEPDVKRRLACARKGGAKSRGQLSGFTIRLKLAKKMAAPHWSPQFASNGMEVNL